VALFVAGKDLFVSKKTRCIAKLCERCMPSPRLSAEGVLAAELGADLVRASIWVGTDRVIISKTFRYLEHLRLRDQQVLIRSRRRAMSLLGERCGECGFKATER